MRFAWFLTFERYYPHGFGEQAIIVPWLEVLFVAVITAEWPGAGNVLIERKCFDQEHKAPPGPEIKPRI